MGGCVFRGQVSKERVCARLVCACMHPYMRVCVHMGVHMDVVRVCVRALKLYAALRLMRHYPGSRHTLSY